MLDKSDKLLGEIKKYIGYIKRGGRERVLSLIVVASFTLAAILAKSDSWLSFLQPLTSLLGPYLQPITFALVAFGATAFLLLVWSIYQIAQPSEREPGKLTPSIIKGPMSFGPQDGEFFQKLGRATELQNILGYIKDPQVPLVVVMGESAGKTSLLRSGLDYFCQKENISLVYWEAEPTNPLKGLVDSINSYCNSQYKSLNEFREASRNGNTVIVLDQFEQLDRDEPKAERIFKSLIGDCEQTPPHRITWVVAFRRDYDPEWRDFELESPDVKLKAAMLSLKLLNDEQSKNVMIAIAEQANFTLDEGLLNDLINSFRGKNGVSPVDIGISMLVLDNLARSNSKSHLTVNDYKIAGGSDGVLTSYLRTKLERLTEDERNEVLNALLRLADLSNNKRIPEGKTLSELAKDAKLPSNRLEVELDYLCSPQVRLLESVQPLDQQKEKTYRLPHERLIDSLRRLGNVLLAEIDQTRLILESCFGIWDSNRKDKFLLSGKDLTRVLKNTSKLNLGEEKQLFVKKSQSRRKNTHLASVAIILIASLATYGGFYRFRVAQFKRDLAQWGLPSDLYEYQRQLKSLSIENDQATHITWLKTDLNELSFHSAGLRSIEALPTQLTYLDLRATRITSLVGIEKLPALTTLDLSDTHITSLAGIEKLPALTTLNLSGTPITSLAGIEKLPALTTLDLSDTHITSLAGIEKLPALTTLDLRRAHITSLAGIEKLPALTTLDLGGTQITSLAGIEKLPALTTLNLSGTQITSLAGIEKLPALTTLNLSGTQITSLAGIEKLPALTTLDLSGTPITSLAGIEKLPALTTLDLSDTPITSLAGIEKLPALTTLNLSDTPITSLAGIEKLPALTTLDLSGTPITSLAGIEKFPALTTLDLRRAHITSLAGIEKLPALTTLDLSDTHITSLAGIEKLPALTTLDLGVMPITSLAGIEKLPALTTLNLSDTQITSLAGIEKHPALTTLDLSGTPITSLAGIEKLPALTTLDLSYTHLSGLDGLEKCKKLISITVRKVPITTLRGLPTTVRKLGL